MKKDWLQEIGRRMSRYERTAPKGTLDDIRREMAQRGLQPSRRSAPMVVSWHRRLAAAAVVLALAGGALFLWHNNENESSVNPDLADKSLSNTSKESRSTSVSSVQHSAESVLMASVRSVASVYNKVSAWAESVTENNSSSNDNGEGSVVALRDSSQANPAPDISKEVPAIPKTGWSRSTTDRDISRGNDLLLSQRTSRRHRSVSVGAFVSGMGYSSNSSGTGMPTYLASLRSSGVESDPTSSSDYTNLFGAKPLGKNASVTHANHKQPVKAGISLQIPLFGRWSVTTGLNYSYLSSDIERTDDSGVENIDQQLHYIGVPVNVNYSVYRSKHLNVYLSAGGMAEKLVKGKATSVMENNDQGMSTDNESASGSIHEHRLQWSVNASAGVEYNFTPSVGVYLEPGVSYHFDNGSDVVNIYKDKPTNFSIGLGVRMNLHAKK